jgi:hypothetical protein
MHERHVDHNLIGGIRGDGATEARQAREGGQASPSLVCERQASSQVSGCVKMGRRNENHSTHTGRAKARREDKKEDCITSPSIMW